MPDEMLYKIVEPKKIKAIEKFDERIKGIEGKNHELKGQLETITINSKLKEGYADVARAYLKGEIDKKRGALGLTPEKIADMSDEKKAALLHNLNFIGKNAVDLKTHEIVSEATKVVDMRPGRTPDSEKEKTTEERTAPDKDQKENTRANEERSVSAKRYVERMGNNLNNLRRSPNSKEYKQAEKEIYGWNPKSFSGMKVTPTMTAAAAITKASDAILDANLPPEKVHETAVRIGDTKEHIMRDYVSGRANRAEANMDFVNAIRKASTKEEALILFAEGISFNMQNMRRDAPSRDTMDNFIQSALLANPALPYVLPEGMKAIIEKELNSYEMRKEEEAVFSDDDIPDLSDEEPITPDSKPAKETEKEGKEKEEKDGKNVKTEEKDSGFNSKDFVDFEGARKESQTRNCLNKIEQLTPSGASFEYVNKYGANISVAKDIQGELHYTKTYQNGSKKEVTREDLLKDIKENTSIVRGTMAKAFPSEKKEKTVEKEESSERELSK